MSESINFYQFLMGFTKMIFVKSDNFFLHFLIILTAHSGNHIKTVI